MYTYPVTLTRMQDGQYMVEFQDVPQALTYGKTKQAALTAAESALYEALDQYMDMRKDIPTPSHMGANEPHVSVLPMVEIKLTIYQAMKKQGITQDALAQRLHCDARQVRRLLDIFHNSTIKQLEAALAVLGYRLNMQATPLQGEQANNLAFA